jgi:hypothetical protein
MGVKNMRLRRKKFAEMFYCLMMGAQSSEITNRSLTPVNGIYTRHVKLITDWKQVLCFMDIMIHFNNNNSVQFFIIISVLHQEPEG